jgi:hypothetical protein
LPILSNKYLIFGILPNECFCFRHFLFYSVWEWGIPFFILFLSILKKNDLKI